MTAADERLAAVRRYNERMAKPYGLRRLWEDEVERIPWDVDDSEVATTFPDGLAACAARYARESTATHTVAFVTPDGRLLPAEGPNEPPIGQAWAVIFTGLASKRSEDNEAEAVRWAREMTQENREQRIVNLCMRPTGKLSGALVEQVAWVFGYNPATIREWRKLHRGLGEPGRPSVD